MNPELFGSKREFTERYRDPTRLRRAVSHFLLRRLKSAPGILAELPLKIQQEHYAPLTSAQSAEYDLALAEYARDSRNGEASGRTGAVLALLTRLKQICNGVEVEADHGAEFSSGKLDILIPLLDEILELLSKKIKPLKLNLKSSFLLIYSHFLKLHHRKFIIKNLFLLPFHLKK